MTTNDQLERRVIVLTSIGHCLCHLCELAFAGLIPAIMLEFGMLEDAVAALMIPGFVMFGVGAIPAGIWADRRSPHEALSGYFLLVFAACWCVYASTTSAWLCIALTLLGTAISVYHPVGLSMISHGCKNRGRAMGINGVAGSLGVALGPSLAIFMAANYSWRLTYLIIGVLALAGFVVSMLLRKDLQQVGHHGTTVAQKESDGQPFKVFAILFVAMLLGGINYRCVTTALPNYLAIDANGSGGANGGELTDTNDLGSTPNGGTIVFVVLAIGGIGQLLGGFLADRFRPAFLYACAIGVTIPLAILIGRSGATVAPWYAAVFAIFMFAEQPLENTMIAQATATKWRSTVYGLKFIFAFGIASSGVYLAGSVWRFYGLARVFDVYAIGATLMLTVAVIYARASSTTRARKTEQVSS